MPNVAGKKYPYTKAGKKAAKKAKSLLTAKQTTLPPALQKKIMKSKSNA